MIYDKVDLIREEVGILMPTKNVENKYSYMPYEDLVDKIYPKLREHKIFCKQYSVTDGSENITIITELIDKEDTEGITLKDASSMPFVQLRNMSALHSRMSISTVLKRIGLVNTLGLAFKDSDINLEDATTQTGLRKKIVTGTPEWDDTLRKLVIGDIDLDEAKSKIDFSHAQLIAIKKATSKF